MKLLLAILILIWFSLFNTSCKKDKNVNPPTVNSSLQYNWNFIKEINKGSAGGAIFVDTIKGLPGDYYNFRADGKLITRMNVRLDTFDYNLLQTNNQVVISKPYNRRDTFEIQVLNNTNLQLFNKYVSGTQISERTIFLTR